MKIPFDIKFKPQIESGEYKVETRDGKPARILCWDKVDEFGYYIVALVQYTPEHENMISVCEDGIYKGTYGHGYDLFIITPEPELSEFEERIFKLLRQYKECDIPLTPENIKAEASMLWLDFEKHFFNLYGREGEGDSALRSFYYKGLADGKAEALKDLPRWRKWGNGACGSGIPIAIVKRGLNGYELVDALGIPGEQYIMLSDLEKLPGFKED